jgi:oligopeptide transport system permease protein
MILFCFVILSVFAPLLSPYGFDETMTREKNQGMSSRHFFGTDSLGRDLWTRIWMGTRVSICIGVVCALLSQLLGTAIGFVAGYYGGFLDTLLMLVVDVCVCVPSLVYVTLITLAIGQGAFSLVIAISLSSWMTAARIARSRMLQYREREFVLSAKAYGASSWRIILKHIIPNIRGQIIVEVFSAIPRAIFTEAYLSFISLGIPSPNTSLGQLCRDGMNTYRIYPYKLYIPSVLLTLLILSFYMLSNDLQQWTEYKSSGGRNGLLS